jgi:DNA-directed RNA polymerase subunit L
MYPSLPYNTKHPMMHQSTNVSSLLYTTKHPMMHQSRIAIQLCQQPTNFKTPFALACKMRHCDEKSRDDNLYG